MKWLNSITDSKHKLEQSLEIAVDRGAWQAVVLGITKPDVT